MESYDEHCLNDGGYPEGSERVVEALWSWRGENGELGGRYYGGGVIDKEWIPIDLYTIQKWGSESSRKDSASTSSDCSYEAFWKYSRSQTATALEIDSRCQSHPG